MELIDELARLVDVFNENRVPYALCGGLAVGLYGYVRATEDLDFLIRSEDQDRVMQAAGSCGYIHDSGTIPFNQGKPEFQELRRVSKVEGKDFLTLGLLIVTPMLEPAWESRREVEWEGRNLSVVSLQGLAHMKRLAGRPKDRLDLLELGLSHDPSAA